MISVSRFRGIAWNEVESYGQPHKTDMTDREESSRNLPEKPSNSPITETIDISFNNHNE
jgi:hypothetical protein